MVMIVLNTLTQCSNYPILVNSVSVTEMFTVRATRMYVIRTNRDFANVVETTLTEKMFIFKIN